jgi:D-sedoheptulose 7-phosphate isomerase
MQKKIAAVLAESRDTKQRMLERPGLLATVEAVVRLCAESLRNGGRLLFCGNGGSAADAQHLAAELSGRFYKDRPPIDAEALHVNSSYLTAVANDYSYDAIFSRMVAAKGRVGDVLLGFSTSGNSPNVLAAFERARAMGLRTVAFTGDGGGQLAAIAEHWLNVPSNDTPRIQEAHIALGHIICELLEQEMFPDGEA